MGIVMNNTTITIADGHYTIEEVYLESLVLGNDYCKKIGNSYIIEKNIVLGDSISETSLSASDVSITVYGSLFQIRKNASFTLGIKDESGNVYAGCYLSCPNIAVEYGFGSNEIVLGESQSGNIYLWNSSVNIPGFWSFFGGENQEVQIIDCIINGYGRIQGSSSILTNITFTESHGRYGVLSTKGPIGQYDNLTSKRSSLYQNVKCSLYFNPDLAPGLEIANSFFDGYDTLVFCEPNFGSVEDGTITIIDSVTSKGVQGYFSDNNTAIESKYSFKPMFFNSNNEKIQGASVVITDDLDEIVFDGTSDINGSISTLLLYIKASSQTSREVLFYDMNASFGGVSIKQRFYPGKSYIDIPVYITAEAINESFTSLANLLTEKIDETATSLATVKIRAEFIKNTPEKVTVSTHVHYGANLKLNILNNDSNQYVQTNIPLTEAKDLTNSYHGTLAVEAKYGSKVIIVSDIGVLEVSNRLKVKNYVYRIIKINGTLITLHKGLHEDCELGTQVDRTGHMGIYGAEVTIPDIGYYYLHITDDIFGLQHAEYVQVQEKSMMEAFMDYQSSETDEIIEIISNKQGYTMII